MAPYTFSLDQCLRRTRWQFVHCQRHPRRSNRRCRAGAIAMLSIGPERFGSARNVSRRIVIHLSAGAWMLSCCNRHQRLCASRLFDAGRQVGSRACTKVEKNGVQPVVQLGPKETSSDEWKDWDVARRDDLRTLVSVGQPREPDVLERDRYTIDVANDHNARPITRRHW